MGRALRPRLVRCARQRPGLNAQRLPPTAHPGLQGPLALLTAMLDGGANPNLRDAGSWTAAMHAAASGQAALLQPLHEHGADFDLQVWAGGRSRALHESSGCCAGDYRCA